MQNPEFAELVLPGLLEPPLEARENFEAVVLSTLLSRATVHSTVENSFEAVLGKIFDCVDQASGLVPVAALEWPSCFGAMPANGCLRADPVHLQVDRDHARLLGGAALELSTAEALALAESLNAHFSEDGIHLKVDEALRWYLTCDRKLDVDMSPPGYAAGRNVEHFLPGGDSSGYWNAFLTEVQMLLHSHPVNQYRRAHDQLAVNSVWLWGGGALADIDHREGTHPVYADGGLPSAMAKRLGQRVLPLPSQNDQQSFTGAFTLVDDTLLSFAIYGLAAEWRSGLERIQSRYLEPALNALQRGRLAGIALYPCRRQCFEVRRFDLMKFWRKRNPLQSYTTEQGSLI